MNVMVSKLEDGVSVDALRAALAACLQAKGKADEAVSRQRAGIDRARGGVRAAEAAAKEAEKAVTKAHQTHAEAIAAAAADDAAPRASGVRAARQAQVDAEDEVEAAKAALAQLKADLPAWAKTVANAEAKIEETISAILEPYARQVLDRARELERQMAPVRKALEDLCDDSNEPSRKPLANVRAEAGRFLLPVRPIADLHAPNVFRALRDRLRSEPYYALPDVAALLSEPR
jgi:hypothetical protein